MISIEQQYQYIRTNLFKQSVIFFPKAYIPEDVLLTIDNNVQSYLFNKVILIKQDGAGYDTQYHNPLMELYSKKSNLDQNIIKLFDLQKNTVKNQYDFLIQRYLQEVDVYIFIYQWFYDNLHLCDHNITKDIKESFRLQKAVLEEHLQELNKHCFVIEAPLKKQENILLDFIENSIPELKDLLKSKNDENSSKKEEQSLENSSQLKNDKVHLKNKEKKGKPKLVTEQQAEAFLLEKVFKIKVK